MPPKIDWKWTPSNSQRELFNEWKGFAIGYLVSSREGCSIRSVPSCLEEHTGEEIPLTKMGFRTINQFLYEMQDSIEVRTLNGKYYVFIRECAVPENLMNIRQLVLGQAKDKGCKTKSGVIKRPTKNQSLYCRAEELITAVQHIINKPASSYTPYRPTTVPAFTSTQGRGSFNARPRPNSIAGRPYLQKPSYVSRTPAPPRTLQNKMFNPQSSGLSRGSLSSTSSKSSFIHPTRPLVTTTAPMQSSRPISTYSKGKENTLYKPTASNYTVQDDDWDVGGPSIASSKSVAMPASKRTTSNSTGRRKYPLGLIETDESEDSDGFDYYVGPSPTVKKTTTTNECTRIASETMSKSTTSTTMTNQSTDCTASVASSCTISDSPQNLSKVSSKTPSSKSLQEDLSPSKSNSSLISTSSKTSSIGTEVGETYRNRLLENQNEVQAVSGTSGNSISSTSSLQSDMVSAQKPSSPSVKSTSISTSAAASYKSLNLPNDSSLGATSEKQNALHQNGMPAGTCKENDSVLLNSASPLITETNASLDQRMQPPTLKVPMVRLTYEVPKIKFPKFLRGGSVYANMSLKAYLAYGTS